MCKKHTGGSFLKNISNIREKKLEKKKFNWFIAGIIIFFALLLLLIFPPSRSHGAETWKQRDLPQSMGEGTHFGISLDKQGNHCGIIFYENKEVRISASFSGERNDCFQNIIISSDGLVEKQLFCEDKKYSKKGKRVCFDIYREKCRKHIDKLPPEFRERLPDLE